MQHGVGHDGAAISVNYRFVKSVKLFLKIASRINLQASFAK